MPGWRHRACIGAQYNIGIEDSQQRCEIPTLRGRQKGVHHVPLPRPVSFHPRGPALHTPSRSTRQLPRRRSGPVHERSNLLERQAEHVMQYERHPFRGRQHLKDHEHRDADRVRDFRDAPSLVASQDFPSSGDRLFAAHLPRAQHVQAHASHHGRQPSPEIFNPVRIGSRQPQPGLLHGIVGFDQRPNIL